MIYRDPSMGCLSFGRISTVRNMNPHKVRRHKRSDLRKGTIRFSQPLRAFSSRIRKVWKHRNALTLLFHHFLDRQDVETHF